MSYGTHKNVSTDGQMGGHQADGYIPWTFQSGDKNGKRQGMGSEAHMLSLAKKYLPPQWDLQV